MRVRKEWVHRVWKKSFVTLLSLNILVFVMAVLFWGSLPKKQQVQQQVQQGSASHQTATVQLAVGDAALNTFMEYALSGQKDLNPVLSYMRLTFSNQWQLQVGLNIASRVLPLEFVLIPQVQPTGNLALNVVSANMDGISAPVDVVFFIFEHLSLPTWIRINAPSHIIDLNFTNRPQQPYGIHIVSYNPTTHLLTLRISMVPKSLLQTHTP
ncbi:DUF2140 family protein [Alicyclobacillaceae bacterium I2511]|nr:DUF2140 family protein [Alicyclobacillaceae bacterium I2511]